jgi:hypothetical protein
VEDGNAIHCKRDHGYSDMVSAQGAPREKARFPVQFKKGA